MGVAALPQHYDYYGAYAEEGSGWRLGEGRGDVAKHDAHPYHAAIDGELTFGWPASFALAAHARANSLICSTPSRLTSKSRTIE